jgi:hypothetical protein
MSYCSRQISRRSTRLAVGVAVVLCATNSRAAELDVTAPESTVRTAPFDVAPEVGRVHAGDKLTGHDQPSGAWRFVQLPTGIGGYLHDSDVRIVVAPPAAPAVAQPGPGAQVGPQTGHVGVLELGLRAAPADDAPILKMLHQNEQVVVLPEVKNGWRRIQLSDGQGGFVPDAGLKVAETPPPPTPAIAAAGGTAAVAATPPSSEPAASSALLGVLFVFLPTGNASFAASGYSASADTAVTVGVAPFLDFPMSTPYFSLGFSPQVIFGVKGSGAANSGTEYDLRARLTGRYPVPPGGTIYARLSPAYSILSLPGLPSGVSNPAGFLIDVSVGGEIAVAPNLAIVIDLGYQAGFQSTTEGNGGTADFKTRFLHLGAGFSLAL